jgi:hypothetical protein
MHILPILPFIVDAVAQAVKDIDAAKADDGKIDAGEAIKIFGAFAIAVLTGIKTSK